MSKRRTFRTVTTTSILLAAMVGLGEGACSAPEAELGIDGAPAEAGRGQGGSDDTVISQGGNDIVAAAKSTLTGQVNAPSGALPISGAVVYLTHVAPDPIPQEVYCDTCIALSDDQPHTMSAPDGSFTLEATTGDWLLVVQKGAFRRVRPITLTEGDMAVSAVMTTLPDRRDPSVGDEVPKMLVVAGRYDHIENSLGAIGLNPGSSFDVVEGKGAQTGIDVLTSYERLAEYHVVFFPCDTNWSDSYLVQPQVLDNLKRYVEAGGRIYTTDYSYDISRQAFPDPIRWADDDGTLNSAESGSYDAWATVTDPGLKEWLSAQGFTNFELEANWTVIDKVAPYKAPDENGVVSTLTPTVWMEGQVPNVGLKPTTVSFQYGCGRTLYSTYHTESQASSGNNLMPQERALLYILLEVSVCLGDPDGGPK